MELIGLFLFSLFVGPIVASIIQDAIHSHKARQPRSILSAYLRNYIKTLRK
jgi:hypothetical protein